MGDEWPHITFHNISKEENFKKYALQGVIGSWKIEAILIFIERLTIYSPLKNL